jgi:hypothetical protein
MWECAPHWLYSLRSYAGRVEATNISKEGQDKVMPRLLAIFYLFFFGHRACRRVVETLLRSLNLISDKKTSICIKTP